MLWLGEMRLAQNQPEAAQPLLAKARSLHATDAVIEYGLGRVALSRHDYVRAVEHLERALVLAPDASRINYQLGLSYRGAGDRRRAEEHLARRADRDLLPEDSLLGELAGLLQNAGAYEFRGAEAMNERRWADAITNLRKASELAPSNARSG